MANSTSGVTQSGTSGSSGTMGANGDKPTNTPKKTFPNSCRIILVI